MELRRYLSILRRRAILIVLTGLVASVFAYTAADGTSSYTAKSTLYVGASQFNFNSPNAQLGGDQTAGLTRIIATFATMIDSEPIAQDALEITGLQRSAKAVVNAITSKVVPGTSLLTVSAVDRDPRVAQELSAGMAEAFVQKIKTLEPGAVVGEGQVPVAPVSLFERAQLPTVPEQSSVLPGMILAGLFGLLFASSCVLLLEYLDVTVKTGDDAERRIELPVLAVVPILRVEPLVLRQPANSTREVSLVRDA